MNDVYKFIFVLKNIH